MSPETPQTGSRGSRVRLIALVTVVVAALVVPLVALAAGRGADSAAGPAARPDFARDVAPIIRDKCASCHQLGGIAPFAFRSARDVAERADAVERMVRARKMPPWPPGVRSPFYRGQDRRALTARERATLLAWVDGASLLERKPVGKPATVTSGPRSGERELRLTAPVSYTPRGKNGSTDDYRCFVLDPGLTADAFVTSARVEPGVRSLVHHVILYRIDPENAAQTARLDAAEAGPGWTCFGGPGVSTTTQRGLAGLDDAGWIAAWAPGWGGDRLADGIGIPIRAGSRVVMQVHYNLLNGRKPDRSSAVLTTVPKSADLTPVATTLLPAPVELPCRKGEKAALCDRTAALEDQVRKYGSNAGFIPAGLLFLCTKNAAAPVASAVSTCDRRVTQPTTVQAVGGHMHLLGASIRVELNPGTPRARVLLDIPRWDFHWQAMYVLRSPIAAKAGDVLRVTCRYDTAKRLTARTATERKPRYILWGEGTTDEMCLGVLQVTRG